MNRSRKILRSLFSLRNLAPMLIIIGALIGSLGLSPFGVKFTDQQVILALLGFLAIDALVERLDVLRGIEEKVTAIQEAGHSSISAAKFFKRRSDFPRMELILKEVKEEVWVSGVSLGTMTTIQWNFSEKMMKGVKVRFLGVDSSGQSVPMLADYYNWRDTEDMLKVIRHNQAVLCGLPVGKRKDSLQFRVIDQVITTGYFIIDPKREDAKMMVQLYQYHNDSQSSPLFVVHKDADPHWFAELLEQYQAMWDAARPLPRPVVEKKNDH